ncbi:hypothetical protein [Streptomyces luteogriseus]|uniref:hypothetical protein n=1 Tax=Streptomyces luteogriseus TaxID=68233 RepID=UPI002E321D9F|nr:hypothetical protein [Streptomyces luteogriseus]WTJ29640.1 hypothetical protein OID52_22610 [Streptomyces luteogriseus]
MATSATSPTLSATEITTPRFRLRRAHDAAALRAAAELPDQPVLIVTRTANTRSFDLPPTSASDRGTFEACEAEQTLAMTVLHSFLAG